MSKEKSIQFISEYKSIFEKAYDSKVFDELLYENFKDEIIKLNFATPLHKDRENYHKDILFVGINPSFRKIVKDKNEIFNDVIPGNPKTEYQSFHFDLDQANPTDTYFGKIRKIVDKAQVDPSVCGYLDLFVYRKTIQEKINSILSHQEGTDFLVQQLEVFHKIVFELVKPKLIVVLNAQAQGFMGLRRFKDKKTKKETNIWLGYTLNPQSLLGINKLVHIQPSLSEEFNKSATQTPVKDEIHVIPFTYLKYVPNAKRDQLSEKIQRFAVLFDIKMNDAFAANGHSKDDYLMGIFSTEKKKAIANNDYERAGKLRELENRYTADTTKSSKRPFTDPI